MLVIRSPSLTFALIYFILAICLAILTFNIPTDDTENLLQLLIISPPLNSIFVFLFALTWIERRFRLSYIPIISLIILLTSSVLLIMISFRHLHISKLIYFSLIYHSFFSFLFFLILILMVICYFDGFLCIQRYRNMMTNEEQSGTMLNDIVPLKLDHLLLQTTDNDQLHLYMSILPGRRVRNDVRSIEDDLSQLGQIQTIITLNEAKELSFMNMTKKNVFDMDTYAMYVKRANYEHILYPIRDRFIPKSLGDFIQFIVSVLINARNLNHSHILVHCLDGMSRTGMTIVCLELTYEYMKKSKNKQTFIERFFHYPFVLSGSCRVCQAICNIRKIRSEMIRNPMQILFIHEFYARLKSNTYMQQIETFLKQNESIRFNHRSSSI